MLYAGKALDKLTPANQDQKVGIDIIRKATQAPIRQIVENAGLDGAVVAGKLLESEDTNYGFNAQNGEYTDMVKAGIIKSKGEGRRLITQGGVSVNDEKATDPNMSFTTDDFSNEIIVKKGKKVFHKFSK